MKRFKMPARRISISDNPAEVADLAKRAVFAAQGAFRADQGAEKAAAVAKLLAATIDIPKVPEPLERVLFSLLGRLAYGFVRSELKKRP